ncbi:MAG TPA: hypothetical protein GX744_06535 [Firmicutes bacterium]|jgi:predicted ribosomally synthesized peptide with SipW-like signal peptide|nr:hypothetical protein [Bacillota bacterium]
MKRAVFIGLAVLALTALLGTGAWAWFSAGAEATNTLTAGTVEIGINEEYTPVTEWIPGQKSEKMLWVKSSGTKAAYVRVALIPVWGHLRGDEFIAEPALPVSNVELHWDEAHWVYADGWYYYKAILAAEAETAPLLSSVTLSSDTGDEYRGKVLQIVAAAEAVQASHEAYKETWGIDTLPDGVEL